MKNLLEKLEGLGATHKVATTIEVMAAEKKLKMAFTEEYKEFLEKVGTVIYAHYEIYGLGVPETYYLSVLDAIPALSENDESYPNNAVPLSEIGDGHYYLYDNTSRKVVVWSRYNGVSEVMDANLEEFIIDLISVD